MSNSIREAIEALAEQWEKEVRGTHPENTRSYWEGRADALNDLRAILALFEESDLTDATLPLMPVSKRTVTLNDSALTDAALYGSPSEGQVREALKDARVCLIAAGFAPTEQYGIINQIDAALSRESAPAKPAEPPAPKVWRCRACEQEFDSKVGMHMEHITDIAGSWCSGPVEEVKPGE